MREFRRLILFSCVGVLANVAFPITDFTFFSVSDPHYGKSGDANDSGRTAVPGLLNNLAGQNYPSALGGGPIAIPRGVTMPGDLVDRVDTTLWEQYTTAYSPLDGKAKMKYAVYDGMGNHDVGEGNTDQRIRVRFIQRNGLRTNLVKFDSLNYHYSWDWDQVHFVQLNLYGGSSTAVSTFDGYRAYEFLKADLEKNVGASGRPVIVLQHIPMDSEDARWQDPDKLKMALLLKDYNCIGIVHGHTHGKRIYKYMDLDVFDDGSAMFKDIMVFHVTDGNMVVANRVGNAWGDLVFSKNISMGVPVTRLKASPNVPRVASEFKFSVEGLGRICAANRRASGVEIRTPAGHLVRRIQTFGTDLIWDRRDESGRAAIPGLYLARILTDAGVVNAKVLLH